MNGPLRYVLVLCVCGLIAGGAAGADERNSEKTKKVEAGRLTLTVPEAWKVQEPTSRLRLAEFGIPSAEGDEVETELTVFAFGGPGGGVDANVQRWIGQFQERGRKQKITRGESPQGKYVLVDLTGTYNRPIGPPIAMQTDPLPNARMLAAIVDTKDGGLYFLKMAGPRKTVDQNAKAFRASFGAEEGKEEEVGRE